MEASLTLLRFGIYLVMGIFFILMIMYLVLLSSHTRKESTTTYIRKDTLNDDKVKKEESISNEEIDNDDPIKNL